MKRNFVDRYNAVVGAAVTVLTAIFGVYWYVFAGFLFFNVYRLWDWLVQGQEAKKRVKFRRIGRDPEKGRLLGNNPGSLFDSGDVHPSGTGSAGGEFDFPDYIGWR